MNREALEQDRCPLCGAAARVWTCRQGRELRRCEHCRFAWVRQGLMRAASGRSIYEEEQRQFGEAADYYHDEGTIDAAAEKLAWVARFVPAGGRLLDVGANFGYFAKAASARYETSGLEPGPGLVAWGREHLHAPIEVGSIYDDRPGFLDRFDAIAMFDVLEHLPDPRTALERCRAWLKPGGRLFITTPDSDSLVARLLGSHWHYVDLIEHIALVGRTNLARLLDETGFSVVDRRTIGRRYRLSYIERRLGELAAAGAPALKLAHLAARPLRLASRARVTINLGDVMGVVAQRIQNSKFKIQNSEIKLEK